MERKRYTLADVAAARFYQMPKFLFTVELVDLSNDARVLYALLRDRHELSIQNKWINDKNEVYLIFTRDEMCSLLGCSENTVRKALNQLKDADLLTEERQGLNRPNLIYLNFIEQTEIENASLAVETGSAQGPSNFEGQEPQILSFKSRNISGSRSSNSEGQEPQILSPNDTDLNDPDLSETDIPSLPQKKPQSTEKKDGSSDFTIAPSVLSDTEVEREVLSTLLSEKQLPAWYADDEQRLTVALRFMTGWESKADRFPDEMAQAVFGLFYDALISMCRSPFQNKKVKGETISYTQVIERFNSVVKFRDNTVDISNIADVAQNNFKNAAQETEIKNPKAYMQSCIWDAMITGNVSNATKNKRKTKKHPESPWDNYFLES